MVDVVIVEAVRSPVGKRNGSFSSKLATELLGDVLAEVLRRAGVEPNAVDRVVGGNVVQVGNQSSNVIRSSWLAAGLPLEVPATTVNVQCGSAQEATSLSHALVGAGHADVVVACGVETMTRIPMGSNMPTDGTFGSPRGGRYTQHFESTTQFEGAERIAERWSLSRDDLEVFGKRSQDLAAAAWEQGRFDRQVVPIEAPVLDDHGEARGTRVVSRDEGLRATTLDGLAALKPNLKEREPAFHTAGTSSQIADGAAALLLMSAKRAAELGVRPRALIVDSVLVGSDPELMLTGPIPATRKLLKRSALSIGDVDTFEVNEAFASVVLAWRQELDVDLDKVNPNGGAIALGHPLGATGAILLTKALHELERTAQHRALVTMCCGGGLGTGTLLERL